MKKIAITEAVGCLLGHDLTEVDPEKKIKRRLFKRGHVVAETDLERLRDLGKNFIYVWQNNADDVHEDDAATEVAPLIAGRNVVFDVEPVEGKIGFRADCDGLFKVDVDRLYQINSLEIPSLPTIHTNSRVTKGQQIAAFRIIPLSCRRQVIDEIRSVLNTPLVNVLPFLYNKAGIVVTGNEVYEGRIKDGFIPKLSHLLQSYQVDVIESVVLPDDRSRISKAVCRLSQTCDIVFVTGGTSVDPDDQTVAALIDAGVVYKAKGNPIQPGNNLTIGYISDVCVCAVPAAALHFRATALDIFLPRLLAGEQIEKETIFRAGHGGLCHFCKQCHFPVCPFGVGN